MDEMKTLEDLLMQRAHAPEPRSNLEYRIIEAARQQYERELEAAQSRGFSFGDVWQNLIETLYLPKPAVAFALILIVGGLVGLSSLDQVVYETNTQVMDSYLVLESDSGYGEYL